MNESCINCKLRYELKKSDYSQGGCIHSNMPGFICMAFADEGIAEWMYGLDNDGKCECFMPKNKQYDVKLVQFNKEQIENIIAFQKQEGFSTAQEAIMTAVNAFLKD